MPREIKLASMRDFTGGLNMRADAFQLAANESPDMLNCDVDPRGGFKQRRGVEPFGNALLDEIHTLWEYATTTGIKQAMASTGSAVKYSTGGNWTLAFNRAGDCHGQTFKDRCYVVDGTTNSVRWNGTEGVALGTGWNTNYDAPTAANVVGNMPIAKFITSWNGSMWVGATSESNFDHPNRIRYSHPNYPEDWHDTGFIDIDPGMDGDQITALVPLGDRLLVFKKRSVHAVFGSGPESFQVQPVSYEVGTISQESVVGTDVGVYFFSWPEGVFLLTAKSGIQWAFERLKPLLDDGLIPAAYQDKIHLGWGNRRLWCSVPFAGSNTRNRCFVLDPTLGGTKSLGSWVAYDLRPGPFLEWNPPGADAVLLAGISSGALVKLDQDVTYDDFGFGNVPIKTRFRTRWVDLGEYSVKKRFKRPDIVLRAGAEAQILVRVFKDFDPTVQTGHFTLSTIEDPEVVDDTPDNDEWDEAHWDDGMWASGSSANTATISERNKNEVQRGATLGVARAVALEFVGPDTLADWGVDSVTYKFIPKRVRS